MKRKIQHNAINNQEDEDSSTYRSYFPGNKISDKKRKGTAEFFNETTMKDHSMPLATAPPPPQGGQFSPLPL